MNYDKQDNYDYNRQPQDADPDDSGDFGYYAEIKDYDADDDAAAQDSMEEYSIPEEPSESGSSGKSTGEGGAKPRMRPVAWRLMLEVLSNPVEGWKSIRRNKLSPAKTQSECFYPMVSVVRGSVLQSRRRYRKRRRRRPVRICGRLLQLFRHNSDGQVVDAGRRETCPRH